MLIGFCVKDVLNHQENPGKLFIFYRTSLVKVTFELSTLLSTVLQITLLKRSTHSVLVVILQLLHRIVLSGSPHWCRLAYVEIHIVIACIVQLIDGIHHGFLHSCQIIGSVGPLALKWYANLLKGPFPNCALR